MPSERIAGRRLDDRVAAHACESPVDRGPPARTRCARSSTTARRAATGSSRRSTPPAPSRSAGQFYMLAAADGWGQRDGRPYLPRAFSVAEAQPTDGGLRLDFLVEAVGPGTERLAELRQGRAAVGHRAARPSLLAAERARLRGRRRDPRRRRDRPRAAGDLAAPAGGPGASPTRTLIGFRDQEHSGGVDELFGCCEVRLASEDGHAGHRGYVTDLLAVLLEGDCGASGGRLRVRAPRQCWRRCARCAPERGVAAELAMEAPDGLRLRGLLRAARSRWPTAATCACAWTARWSMPRRSRPPWSRGPGTDAMDLSGRARRASISSIRC